MSTYMRSLIGFVRDLNSMEEEIREAAPMAARHLGGVPQTTACLATLENAALADPLSAKLREVAAKLVCLAIANGLWDPVELYSSIVANGLSGEALKRRTRDAFRDDVGAIQRRNYLLSWWRQTPKEWRNIRAEELANINAAEALRRVRESYEQLKGSTR